MDLQYVIVPGVPELLDVDPKLAKGGEEWPWNIAVRVEKDVVSDLDQIE